MSLSGRRDAAPVSVVGLRAVAGIGLEPAYADGDWHVAASSDRTGQIPA